MANTSIVRRLVENLIESGCTRIIVVVGHHKQQICGAVADFAEKEAQIAKQDVKKETQNKRTL